MHYADLWLDFRWVNFHAGLNIMAEIKLDNVWAVDIIESERGWGSKVDETKLFDSKESADAFVKEYNKDNTAAVAPDWYMAAQTPYRVK